MKAGKNGKPDRLTVSAKSWAVISERLGTGRSTGALQQHWEIMNGKRRKGGGTVGAPAAADGEVAEALPEGAEALPVVVAAPVPIDDDGSAAAAPVAEPVAAAAAAGFAAADPDAAAAGFAAGATADAPAEYFAAEAPSPPASAERLGTAEALEALIAAAPDAVNASVFVAAAAATCGITQYANSSAPVAPQGPRYALGRRGARRRTSRRG